MAYEVDIKEMIQAIYIAYYGRPADPAGLGYWFNLYNTGALDLAGIAENFAQQSESKAEYAYFNTYFNYPGYPISDQMRIDFVTEIYQNLFERAPDTNGLNYWVNALKTGAVSPGAFIAAIVNAAYEGRAGASATDWLTLYNKIQVADNFTDYLVENNISWTMALSDQVEAVLDTVTATSDVNAVNQQVEDIIEGQGQAGQTFTLTTGIDNIVGTSGNDTIIGDNTTSSAADQVNGGGGTDTLKLYNSTGNPVLPTISGIENIYIKNSTANYDVSTFADVKSLEIDTVDVSGARTYTLASGQSLTLTNVTDSGDSNNDVEVNAAASVTAHTITLNGVGDTAAGGNDVEIDINGTGVKTLNLAAQGAASKVTLVNTGNALETLNVSGDKSVTILDVPNAKTIAITNTAGASVTTSVPTNTAAGLTITAAGGKDSVTLAQAAGANALTNKTAVDLGAGDDTLFISKLDAADNIQDGASFKGGDDTDTLKLFDGDVIDATTGKLFSGFEVVDIGGAQATTNLNLAHLAANNTISKLLLSAPNTAAVNVTNLPEAAVVELAAAHGANLTINQKDSGAGSPDDSITLNWNSKTAIGAATGTLTVADIETVNVNVTSTGTNITHEITSLVVANATKVTVNASTAAVDIKNGFDAVSLVLFDASASAKKVTVALNDAYTATAGVAVKGGAGDDVITLTGATTLAATVNDLDFIITGGKGADNITLAATTGGKDVVVYTAQSDSTYNKYDSITNFDATAANAQDYIDLKAFGFTGNQQNVKVVTSGVSLDASNAVIVAAGSQTNFFVDTGVARGVAVWDAGSDVFVFVDANKDGNFSNDADLVIKLVGVANATDITTTDLIFA
uniref:DUF4214 domain-containing protein n=1 Tax=Desulfacinum infernum TaxID=35837 RepID=A0A832EKG1_9BACT